MMRIARRAYTRSPGAGQLPQGFILQDEGGYTVLQRLPTGFQTKAHRHTASSVYLVARGSDSTTVDGERHGWQERDIVAVPPWTWHEHVANAASEAVLRSISDRVIVEPFGLYREATSPRAGGPRPIP